MQKRLAILMLCITSFAHCQQTDSKSAFYKDIKAYQMKMNADFSAKETSPLPEKDRKSFRSLDFYEPSEKYKIEADFTKTMGARAFKMQTSTNRTPMYQEYGTASFKLDGKQLVLHIYQNIELMSQPEYKDYLFIPFNDLTNGEETYGGGRYLEVSLPVNGKITLDFNKAYNPYCAYNHKYSCPIPPKENNLSVAIKAGVKAYKKPK
ncbi:DUF1684 domain-containing protein [Flavobacteriaceae bacterium F08102]|nr:DUF1684 domain-containing protein [Flavobacteriaceae bacterium F08102]